MGEHKNLEKFKETIDERMAEQKRMAVEYYGAMPILKHAAAFAGISDDTITRWKTEDLKFAEDLSRAKSGFIRAHGRKAKPEFLLERLDKENFRESKELEVTLPTPIMSLEVDDEDKRANSKV